MYLSPMDQYWVWLSSIDGIGPKRFYQLLSIYEDPRCVWDHAGEVEMKFLGHTVLQNLQSARNEAYFQSLFEKIEKLGIQPIPRIDARYPALLSNIYDPPATLYALGACEFPDDRIFSMVGSRRATRDGVRAAREIAEGLAREGVTVVSGMAHGIDTAAHEGALIGLGKTIAVLGCGVDVIYPPENEALYHRILENGGTIVSEYVPGMQPLSANFPARNRIISGLTLGTLLVEGAKKSGAMITVNDAIDQNRDVFAVPGSIYSALSVTPNQLIVDGCIPVTSAWNILEHYRWAERPSEAKGAFKPKIQLDPEDDQIVTPLLEQELTFEELANRVDFTVAKLNSHLTMLELRGIIVKVPGGAYRAYL